MQSPNKQMNKTHASHKERERKRLNELARIYCWLIYAGGVDLLN
jgi:hypothetical protein